MARIPNNVKKLLVLFLPCLTAVLSAKLQRFEQTSPQMGALFRIVLYEENEISAQKAFQEAFKRVETLNSILSDYQQDSELSRLSKTAGSGMKVKVSRELWTVLRAAHEISEASDGAFDVTVGPFARLWKLARHKRQIPSPDRIARFRPAVDYQKIEFHQDEQAIRLLAPDMFIDLGGIAKGYAADEVLRTLESDGIKSALVDAGGDIVLGDAPPGTEGWRIAIGGRRHPELPTLKLSNCAVATSGDVEQFLEISGQNYSHIVDPRTGMGLTNRRQATIIATTGMKADALASAACILPFCSTDKLINSQPGVQAYLLEKTGKQTTLKKIP
ncbi:MAG: FAD:protein FMN transferase [Opitutales bacterium]|nr:FAD:protein FMN transferase [Opitutales bacterium]